METSDPSSINSSELDTMGNILASSNANDSQASEADRAQDEPRLAGEHCEVSECPNDKIPDISADDATENRSAQGIDVSVIGKCSGSVQERDAVPETSGTVETLTVSESDDNVEEDLWLAGDATRELVKVETDEDFDVIVKSLETAIVETERYDILEPASSVDPGAMASGSLLDDFAKDLVSPPSLSEMAEHGERIMLSEDVEMTDDITRELEVEASKLQTEVSDTDDQCLERLMDTSMVAGEFATITDDMPDTFDEQSTSLFEAADAVTELTENTDSRPSLLELQEAAMTCDIAEQMNRDVLPVIADVVLNEDSPDSAQEILNDIVDENIASEARIDAAIDQEVDEVMLEFPETESARVDDENTAEMLNKSVEMPDEPVVERSVEMKAAEEQATEENRVGVIEKIGEMIREETGEKLEESAGELTETAQSEVVLAKEVEKSEVMTDINTVPQVNIENLADGDIFERTDIIDQRETTQADVSLTEPEIKSPENSTAHEMMTDTPEIITSVRLESTDSHIERLVVSRDSEIEVESKLNAETAQVQVELSETSMEQAAVEENQDQLSIAPESVRLGNVTVVLEENSDKVPVVLEKSVDDSSVKLDDHRPAVTVQESVDSSRVTLDDNQRSDVLEEDITLSAVSADKCSLLPEEITTTVSHNSQVTPVKPITAGQITESRVDEPESSATADKPSDNEDSTHTCASSSESLSSVREDQVKPASDAVEKEHSPPKKIKLIREKLYIPPVNISTVNTTAATGEDVSSENISETITSFPAEQVIEKTSPVRTRKLKLKRDYEPEQVVTRLESELIRSELSVTRDTDQMSSVVSEHSKSSTSETISDRVTVQCESQDIITQQDDLKMVGETELTVDTAMVPDSRELDVNLSVDKVLEDAAEPISEHKSVLVEVKVQSASEVRDTKQVEPPANDSTSKQIPLLPGPVDVPTASDDAVPTSETITSADDAETSIKSPESPPDRDETCVEVIAKSPGQVKPEESPSAGPVPTSEVEISEETTAEKPADTEECTLAPPERVTLPAEPKPSILQQMLMKAVVVPIKEAVKSSLIVAQPSNSFVKDVETMKQCANEADESTVEDALLRAATEVETRSDAHEENDDALKQAAQEAEIRDHHAAATMQADEAEFAENAVSICEDEIIAVTQALEMERAQENLVEMSKTESSLEICKEKPAMLAEECSVTQAGDQSPLESEEIIAKPTMNLVAQDPVAKVAENKLKRHLEDAPSTSGVAVKKSKTSKETTAALSGRKLKSSPVTGDSVSIDVAGAKQSVTIEPVNAPNAVENVGKLRISRRKLEEPPLCKSVTITRPLRVEVDDLGNASVSPSYYRDADNVPKIVIKPIPKPEERSSPKITIKPIVKPSEMVISPKMSSKSKGLEDVCTPRITIKPIMKPDPLKITITKQRTDDTHSILKIYKPCDDGGAVQLKPAGKSGDDTKHSPRITIKPVKPPHQSHSPATSVSPKVTVKPVLPPPNELQTAHHSPKITVKSSLEDASYPKVTIKPILRPDDSARGPMSPRQLKLKTMMTFESSSGVTVEPVAQHLDTQLKISVKSFAKMEETLSPKLTIKPITKTCEIVQSEDGSANPLKLTIKPLLKPEESSSSYQSPKITIKPIMKPPEMVDQEEKPPERIILKIQKTSLPSPKERTAHHAKESRKEPEVKIEAILQDCGERNQKLDKIKLKLTKEGSHAQIIPSGPAMLSEQFSLKRPLLFSDTSIAMEKRSKSEFSGTELLHNPDISINLVEPNAKPHPKTISEEVTIVKLDRASSSGASPLAEHISQSRFKEMLLKIQQKADITCTPHTMGPEEQEEGDSSGSSDDVRIVGVAVLGGGSRPAKDPLSLMHDESSSPNDVVIVNENPFHNVQIINAHTIIDPSAQQQTPKKRGRPRKNPLEVKPEIKGEDCVEIVRPKRTCRAPPGRTPFAVKERKPRGAGRARGRGRGGGGAGRTPAKPPKEPKTPRGKALKEAKALAKLEAAKLAHEVVVIDAITIEDSTNDTTPVATPAPPPSEDTPPPPPKLLFEQQAMIETEAPQACEELLKEPPLQLPPPPLVVYEEETRMSADNSSSRAQTPARQVTAAPPPLLEGPEESQSSVQSSATTESNKNKKGRLEVCDGDSAVTAVEQIAEYTWGVGGTYMLQEQIAQFLGVKSFKRKYPGLTRRPVEMQERDYIREKGLVSESMCDMGLTAVPSSEILDIMYTDFQEKYEEYRKCMRDKQSKEISNKQKAISLATSQEKNKIDFKERAIRSAANWNVNFNKTRKESRRCCMDLQTFTINFPLGRGTQAPQKSPVGQYPIALVPGQFTDYYKRYTANELHYLPLNTVRYGPVMPNQHCTDAGQSDGSQSDSDSSSGSDSDSSDDSMSTVEDTPTPVAATSGFAGKPGINLPLATPKAKVH